jgi:hypothetical protein
VSVPFDPAGIAEFKPARALPFHISSINLNPDGSLEIQYLDKEVDVKAIGAVLMHSLLVPPTEDYADNIQSIRDAAGFLVADVTEDWDNLEPDME